MAFDIRCANAEDTANSFLGLTLFNSEFTVRNVTMNSLGFSDKVFVTFKTNGAVKEIDDLILEKGNVATAPALPKKVGYIFDGWYTSEDGGVTLSETAFDFSTAINGDITLYAKWIQNENTTEWLDSVNGNIAFVPNEDHSVTITVGTEAIGLNGPGHNQAVYLPASKLGTDGNYSDFYYSFNLKAEDNIDFPFHPLSFNYGVLGGPQVNITLFWQLEAGVRCWTNGVLGGESFVGTDAETTYIATSYKVGEVGKVISGPIDSSATQGLTWDKFIVGYLNQIGMEDLNYDNGHDFCVRFTKDTVNTSLLIRIYYSTTCETDKLIFSFEIKNSETALNTADSFFGISLYNTTFILSEPEMKSVVTKTVNFDSAGGTAVESQTVVEGEIVAKPSDPEKDDYRFIGWFYGDKKWDFDNDTVSNNITLTAKWENVGTQGKDTKSGCGSMIGSSDITIIAVLILASAFLCVRLAKKKKIKKL